MRHAGALAFGALALALAACASGPESQAARSASGTPLAPGSAAYIIGAEDLLSVTVWKEEGLSRQVRVRPDGRISFPLVGDLQAAGLTTAQLQIELTSRLASLLTAPAVTVIVDEINSYKVYVVGEVARPGLLPTRSPVTVLQALSLAGGLREFADGDNMVLVRQVDGRTYRARVNYKDLVLGRNGAVDVMLESGDTLVVP